MRAIAVCVVAASLAACAPSVRERTLAGLDLADGNTLATLQAALTPDDRAALGTYALLHWPKSKFYCGRPIGDRGVAAKTIGEAIDQTRAYEVALQRVQAAAQIADAAEPGAAQRALVTRMEALVLERDRLRSRIGPVADESPRGVAISQQLALIRAELEKL